MPNKMQGILKISLEEQFKKEMELEKERSKLKVGFGSKV